MVEQYNSLTLQKKKGLLTKMEMLPTCADNLNELREALPLIKGGMISLGNRTSVAMDLVECALELANIASESQDTLPMQTLQDRFPHIQWDNIKNETREDIKKKIAEQLQYLVDEKAFKDLMERLKDSIKQP
ncbi:uncharacterized protein LOC118458795 [Anopheles albimanus]|uniref:Uncharacterized protein n=1 Tax=Anopheles albimanus TaxID=7167 RepID=A0A182FYY8_ANOAL|nr:uncharacterized protein LOC118458795 [Anopheles albimanus]XP_035777534.1 uncharacterized protein LOC118458795 [Anopheles albimanus]XP_035777535.1 uncharacterized protein LOC118458795 [Anopheles albimanus]